LKEYVVGPEASEPLEPDEVVTADELLQKRDPRIGVADANGAVKRRRWMPGGWRRRTSQYTQRERERGPRG
jgi:hypothetical protein